jgi:hypothetical protein
MSRENLDVLRRLNEAFNRRDVDAAVQCLDPEVELHPGIQVPDEESRYIGRDGLMEWFRNATDPLGDDQGRANGADRRSRRTGPRGRTLGLPRA